MKQFDMPGVAVTVVKDGKILMAKGYGVATLGQPGPVTPHTLFAIASNTKAFTATALLLLAEEGKLALDDKVVKYLPGFAMSNPYVTAELTLRDLLTHRSGLGLGAGDLLIWPQTNYSRAEIVRRLRYVPLATSFRASYAYDNVLYLVAGEVVQAVSGMTWEDFVQRRIMAPIGMRDARIPVTAEFPAGVATPHASVDGVLKVVTGQATTNDNPAGGILASAEDMAAWLITQVDSGRAPNGTRLFPARVTRQLWNIVTPITPGVPNPAVAPARASFNGYALGFNVRDWRGQQVVTHTGGLNGFISRVIILPQQRVGISVLLNSESPGRDAIAYRLADHFLGADFDWAAAVATVESQNRDNADPNVPTVKRDTAARLPFPIERYAGRYEDPWYGFVDITAAQGKLRIKFSETPALVGELVHWGHDTFVARWDDRTIRGDAYVTFSYNPDRSIAEVRMQPVSPAVDFSYDYQDLRLKPVTRR